MFLKPSTRPENEIFKDLSELCTKPGFIHVIATLCFRDTVVGYKDEMKAKDMARLFSKERLIRTELMTLVGLMLKKEIVFTLPSLNELHLMGQEAESLLKEIHQSMFADFDFKKAVQDKTNPFQEAKNLREPIFYGGESAYIFQYRDLALKRYSKDDNWFLQNKGYTVADAHKVITCIGKFQNDKLLVELEKLANKKPEEWTMLQGFEFSVQDLSNVIDTEIETIRSILSSFATPLENKNKEFCSLGDFNIINAYPLIKSGKDKYLLFQPYSLAEAFYETPFFWMYRDESYKEIFKKNRGLFVEEFAEERLKLVFGAKNVFSNINIYEGKKKDRVAEIDTLVVFADRAIILQAKSGRLRLGESRKGNDIFLKEDFKKAIQDAYDQGLISAKLLENEIYNFRDRNGNDVLNSRSFKEVYIFCVTSEHYPALSFQSRQFLQYEKNDKILPPLVIDVFMLDAVTEMLQTPLYFLSYINRRALYGDKVMAHHELTILSYHLKKNLWISDENTMMHLDDSICADLDMAMSVRRGEFSGKDTMPGIMTVLKETHVGNFISQIEHTDNRGLIDLGFTLLSLNEEAIKQINDGMKAIINLTKKDGKNHDFSIYGKDWGGITIHCNNLSNEHAFSMLKKHCERRKYIQKTKEWFGICIDPVEAKWRWAIGLNDEWKRSEEMDRAMALLSPKLNSNIQIGKIGRNNLCPCESGKKYKKCCL